MKEIRLREVVPEVFARLDCNSEVWLKQLSFLSGKKYLLEAVSGAGKSSLCSYIYGYRHDYRGNITFDEKDIRDYQANDWSELRKTALSILFQELRLFQELSVWENLLIKNRLTGFKSEKWIRNSLERLGIEEKAGQMVGKLSFGQQQRVAVIRALCQPFRFLLLDEPVSHLDEENNRIVGELIREEADSQEAGIVVTSIGKKLELSYDKILHL